MKANTGPVKETGGCETGEATADNDNGYRAHSHKFGGICPGKQKLYATSPERRVSARFGPLTNEIKCSAVGQLVRTLEQWLGAPLFDRGGSGRARLIPTRVAERALKPDDLDGQTLIHDLSMDRQTGFPTWETWLERAGVKHISATRGMKINNSAAVLQAAIDGRGIAFAQIGIAAGATDQQLADQQ